jgi:hypothetical protein
VITKKYKLITPKGECLGTWADLGSEDDCRYHVLFRHLNITLEEIKPEKKKLYAHRVPTLSLNGIEDVGLIGFYDREQMDLKRAPEFDLEFDNDKGEL